MPSDRRRGKSARYHHGDDSSDDEYTRHRSSRPRGYSPKLQRGVSESSLMKKEEDAEAQDETQWDTDYDPRDKYYLSQGQLRRQAQVIFTPEAKLFCNPAPTSTVKGQFILPKLHTSSPYDPGGLIVYYHIPRTPPAIPGTVPRPRDRLQNINWEEAMKVALQAGTVAAVKVGTDPIPWTKKGTKIASAALGAAVVDHVLQPKKKGGVRYAAMRHLTEMAVGGMVVGPALGKVEARRKR
ncbi:hypothetical protein VPNG_06106 [Cytospora leucostoma]|uniref:Uncharacterized protein n=1 Tax=Cytospora leucostoma TaxID=1230097 RepID=A0A423WX46_9PEZI|nr:hypothetical protein VPNG_06106 [Cytospora leucostoma]